MSVPYRVISGEFWEPSGYHYPGGPLSVFVEAARSERSARLAAAEEEWRSGPVPALAAAEASAFLEHLLGPLARTVSFSLHSHTRRVTLSELHFERVWFDLGPGRPLLRVDLFEPTTVYGVEYPWRLRGVVFSSRTLRLPLPTTLGLFLLGR